MASFAPFWRTSPRWGFFAFAVRRRYMVKWRAVVAFCQMGLFCIAGSGLMDTSHRWLVKEGPDRRRAVTISCSIL